MCSVLQLDGVARFCSVVGCWPVAVHLCCFLQLDADTITSAEDCVKRKGMSERKKE